MYNIKRRNRSFTAILSLQVLWVLAFLVTPLAWAQEGRVVREVIHSAAVEKNVTGESADRNVTVYLPPSYDTSNTKRYPVIYLLHGIGDTDELWTRSKQPWNTIQELMNRGIAEGRFGEMIIVMPDERTKWFGSFYTNSTVTGNWEEFTTKELISYIDNKYRTLTQSGSRGIAGHSMGGYGAITLAMKYPEYYSVVYGMNPALIAWSRDLSIDHPGFKQVLTAKTLEELLKGGIRSVGLVTIAQAFSPNPSRAPFFADFPFEMVDGKLKPATSAFQRWQEHFPVNMIERYQTNLAKLRSIRFDSGIEDEFLFIPVNCNNFSAALTSSGIEHVFEEYNGDHRNRLWGRNGRLYTEVLPYFWFSLDNENSKK